MSLLTLAEVLKSMDSVYTATNHALSSNRPWKHHDAQHRQIKGRNCPDRGQTLRVPDIGVPEAVFVRRTNNANFEL